MAQSKEDIKYGAAQAKLSEDEMLRVRYKHGTPLEGGKIAEAEPVDLFANPGRISQAFQQQQQQQQQLQGKNDDRDQEGEAARSGDLKSRQE